MNDKRETFKKFLLTDKTEDKTEYLHKKREVCKSHIKYETGPQKEPYKIVKKLGSSVQKNRTTFAVFALR
jgi:hypothetical protein